MEGAAGLGHLLAQQLVAAGEQVLDVPPKLAARVRLLQAGDTNKNDPNDALSVAVAALRAKARRPVIAEDHAAVLKIWAKRHRDLSRARNQAACRLHAVLCDLVPGGHPKEISAAQAARILEQVTPSGAVAGARTELAAEFLADLRRLDAQLRDTRKKLAAAVKASGTSLTQVFGVGPVDRGHRDRRRPAGVPVPQPGPFRRLQRHRAGGGVLRAAGRSTGCRCAATGASTMRSTWPRSPRSGTGAATAGPITRRRSPRARRTRRRCGPSSAGSATRSTRRSWPMPGRRPQQPPAPRAREGNRGTALSPGRPAHTPQHRLFGQATPGPATTLRPVPHADEPSRQRRPQGKPGQPLDNKCKEVSLCAPTRSATCQPRWARNWTICVLSGRSLVLAK